MKEMRVPWAMPYMGKEELDEVVDTIKSTWVTMGPKAKRLENEISNYFGVKHGIAVNSGTAALDVALKMIGIQAGDEVIIPAMTYIATANAILYQHARPVLADIDRNTYTIDPEDVLKRITNKTKCIMPIDYGGQGADYDALTRIAEEQGVHLVVDGAQSIGGEYKGRKLCSFGEISTASFHAAKVITSIEGGMVFTDNDELANRARIIRNQGEDPQKKYHHTFLGHNYRMTDLHAAVGLAQFKRLDDIIRKRASMAEYYTQNLQDYADIISLPYVAPHNKHAWFLYAILVNDCDKVEAYLRSKGVDTRRSWPLPIHKQPIYHDIFSNASYPVAEEVSQRILNLPMYYAMTREEQDYVIKHLKDAVKGG
ncbi:DegT/DnrJ/EryC1/StrS family aminotransferase [Chloroflexota bacterium]